MRRVNRFATIFIALCVAGAGANAQNDCKKPLYLTFDTGHMGVAQLIADVLRREQVPVTFFAAHERTQEGDGSLGEHWAPWWAARAAEGHAFASHTWSHAYWRADASASADAGANPAKGSGDNRSSIGSVGGTGTGTGTGSGAAFVLQPSAGPRAGERFTASAADYCAEIRQAADRLRTLTGQAPLPLWRAPGGKTSPALLAAGRACGFAHVGWSPAGFLGDELPSESASNAQLLQKALRDVRPGDILMAHLGIWSRRDPWASAVLQPLLQGLKAQGFCFRTLREHPQWRDWIAAHPVEPRGAGAAPGAPSVEGRK